MARVIINKIKIGKKLNGVLITQRRFQSQAFRAANTRFLFAQLKLLKDFDDSEVTKEIVAGATANSSFLPKGNLVSFLGLRDGPKAIAKLRGQLERRTKIGKTPEFIRARKGVIYEFKIKAPTLEELYEINLSPWSNKSWIYQIENGLSNFLYYLYSKTGRFAKWSISGTGLQAKKGNKGSKVLKIKWISTLLKNFAARFS